MKFYKYHGAGNDFLIADGREGALSPNSGQISFLCNRRTGFGADGLMVLGRSDGWDFTMDYFNSDGSGGMMCGNGGRCIVAFAHDMGLRPAGDCYKFTAPDGPHKAQLLKDGRVKIVRLRLKSVSAVEKLSEGEYYADTGARHFVKVVPTVEIEDFVECARAIRYEPRFAPIGVNVNFIAPRGRDVIIRTYEKGVEDETLACGTGSAAAAVCAYYHQGLSSAGRAELRMHTRISTLGIDFMPGQNSLAADDLWLTGPAVFVGTCEVDF